MSVTSDRQYGQILTASIANYSEKIQDLVFDSLPLTAILKEKGLIQPYDGGPEIRVPLEIDKLQAQWFTGYDKIRISPKELINAAFFTPKRVVAPFSLTGTELLYNGAKTQRIKLLKFYLNNARKGVAEAMEEAYFGDGTADGGRQMVGFAGSIPINPALGTYGGISRVDNPIWRPSVFSVPGGDFPTIGTTWTSATARKIISTITSLRSRGSRHADIAISDLDSWETLDAGFVAHQRIGNAKLGELGFDQVGLVVNTGVGPITVLPATGIGTVMPDNTIFGLDTDALAIYYHPNNNMVPLHDGDGAKPLNQDAIAQGIVWTGEQVLSNPLFTWRLITGS